MLSEGEIKNNRARTLLFLAIIVCTFRTGNFCEAEFDRSFNNLVRVKLPTKRWATVPSESFPKLFLGK